MTKMIIDLEKEYQKIIKAHSLPSNLTLYEVP